MGIRFLILCAFWTSTYAWSNLNCSAPRSPANGLSFIFNDGSRVEFRCHPGYRMDGEPEALCEDNQWSSPPPDCIPVRKGAPHVNDTSNRDMYEIPGRKDLPKQEHRELFSWGSVYGDGARRLPLINGIWPTQEEADKVLALGPQSTPGPRNLMAEEINIAELRQKQLDELKSQRNKSSRNKGKKRNGSRRKNKNRNGQRAGKDDTTSTVLSLGETQEGPSISVSRVNHRRHHRHRQNRQRQERRNNRHHSNGDFISNRKSRVDTGSISPHNSRSMFRRKYPEMRRRPMQEISYEELKMIERQTYDATCVEETYNNRHVPSMAPDIRKAFVFRYETKKNGTRSYMVARYKCMNGFHFRDERVDRLFCQHKNWIGELPKCINNRMRG